MPRQTPASRVENAAAGTTARVITAIGDAIAGPERPANRRSKATRKRAKKPISKPARKPAKPSKKKSARTKR